MPRKGKSKEEPKQPKKPKKAAPAPKASKVSSRQKKSVAKATSVSSKKTEIVREKSTLTPKDLAHFQLLLLTKRAELVGDVNSMEDEALQKSKLSASGDLSTMPIHMADIGTANYEQEFSLGLLDGERKILREINDALLRIEDGTYGICEGTGKEIARARLEANPWARYCVEYARMVEQGLVREGDTFVSDDDDDDITDDEDVLDEGDESDETEEDAADSAEEELPIEDDDLEEDGMDWRESKDS